MKNLIIQYNDFILESETSDIFGQESSKLKNNINDKPSKAKSDIENLGIAKDKTGITPYIKKFFINGNIPFSEEDLKTLFTGYIFDQYFSGNLELQKTLMLNKKLDNEGYLPLLNILSKIYVNDTEVSIRLKQIYKLLIKSDIKFAMLKTQILVGNKPFNNTDILFLLKGLISKCFLNKSFNKTFAFNYYKLIESGKYFTTLKRLNKIVSSDPASSSEYILERLKNIYIIILKNKDLFKPSDDENVDIEKEDDTLADTNNRLDTLDTDYLNSMIGKESGMPYAMRSAKEIGKFLPGNFLDF